MRDTATQRIVLAIDGAHADAARLHRAIAAAASETGQPEALIVQVVATLLGGGAVLTHEMRTALFCQVDITPPPRMSCAWPRAGHSLRLPRRGRL